MRRSVDDAVIEVVRISRVGRQISEEAEVQTVGAKDRNVSVHVAHVFDQIGRRIARRGQVQQIPDGDVQVVDVLRATGSGLRHRQVNLAEQTGRIQSKVVDVIAGEQHRLGGDQVGDS